MHKTTKTTVTGHWTGTTNPYKLYAVHGICWRWRCYSSSWIGRRLNRPSGVAPYTNAKFFYARLCSHRAIRGTLRLLYMKQPWKSFKICARRYRFFVVERDPLSSSQYTSIYLTTYLQHVTCTFRNIPTFWCNSHLSALVKTKYLILFPPIAFPFLRSSKPAPQYRVPVDTRIVFSSLACLARIDPAASEISTSGACWRVH